MAAAASMPMEPACTELSPDRERGGNDTGMEWGRERGTRRGTEPCKESGCRMTDTHWGSCWTKLGL